MKNRNPFSSLKLSNGDLCIIYEVKAWDIMRGNFQMLLLDAKYKVGLSAYIYQSVIRINDKEVDLDYIFNLSIEDYSSIIEIIDVSLKKIKI